MTAPAYAREARSTVLWGLVPIVAFSLALGLRSPWLALVVVIGAVAALAGINSAYLARSRARRRDWTAEGRAAWDARPDNLSSAALSGWWPGGWSDFTSVVVEVRGDIVLVQPRRGQRSGGSLERSRVRRVRQSVIGRVSPEGWIMPTPFTHVRITTVDRDHLDLLVLVDADDLVRALSAR